MGKVIILGESHIDPIVKSIILAAAESDLQVKLTESNLLLPFEILACEWPKSYGGHEKIIQHAQTMLSHHLQEINSSKSINKKLKSIIKSRLVKEFSEKVIFFSRMKKLHSIFIDKAPETFSLTDYLVEEEQLLEYTYDQKRNECMATHLCDIYQSNPNTLTIALVGVIHLNPINALIQKMMAPEDLKNFVFIHCFSDFNYNNIFQNMVLTAPFMCTSWKDDSNIYYLDCRNKKTEDILNQIQKISEHDEEFLDKEEPNFQIKLTKSLYFCFRNTQNILIEDQKPRYFYNFSKILYDNTLCQSYHSVCNLMHKDSLDKSTFTKIQNIQNEISNLSDSTDPRLHTLFTILVSKKESELSETSLKEELKELILKLKHFIDVKFRPPMTKLFDIDDFYLNKCLLIFSALDKGKITQEQALKRFSEIIEISKKIYEIFKAEIIKLDELYQKDFLFLQDINDSSVIEFKLEAYKKILSDPKFIEVLAKQSVSFSHTFGLNEESVDAELEIDISLSSTDEKDYYDAIDYYCLAMLALNELEQFENETNKEHFILENLKKAAEKNFVPAYLELGFYYGQKSQYEQAAEVYLKAADLGSRASFFYLAEIIIKHLHSKVNFPVSKTLILIYFFNQAHNYKNNIDLDVDGLLTNIENYDASINQSESLKSKFIEVKIEDVSSPFFSEKAKTKIKFKPNKRPNCEAILKLMDCIFYESIYSSKEIYKKNFDVEAWLKIINYFDHMAAVFPNEDEFFSALTLIDENLLSPLDTSVSEKFLAIKEYALEQYHKEIEETGLQKIKEFAQTEHFPLSEQQSSELQFKK